MVEHKMLLKIGLILSLRNKLNNLKNIKNQLNWRLLTVT